MYHVYSVLLAAGILYAAPIVANPLAIDRASGGSSVHFKTVEEGVWPYRVENSAEAQASSRALSAPSATQAGYWI